MTEPLTVTQHYGSAPLIDRVRAVLLQAGLGSGRLAWSDVAALDQFHVRGLAATKELAGALSLTPETRVLDVGSGLGGPARFLASVYGCHVTGIDLSAPFVEVAQMLAERTGLADRVTYREANALDLPFEDGTFDHAWTQHVAMNIQDRAALYAEIRRVLKPGGLLAIYDVVAGNGEALHFPVPWARHPDISFLLTPDAMRNTLEASGFSVVSWEDKTDAGLSWYAEQAAKSSRQSGGTPALGIGVVMGPEFAQMAANLGRNLHEGRTRLVQAVLKRN
jgi:SAM-dependent methyltransferase